MHRGVVHRQCDLGMGVDCFRYILYPVAEWLSTRVVFPESFNRRYFDHDSSACCCEVSVKMLQHVFERSFVLDRSCCRRRCSGLGSGKSPARSGGSCFSRGVTALQPPPPSLTDDSTKDRLSSREFSHVTSSSLVSTFLHEAAAVSSVHTPVLRSLINIDIARCDSEAQNEKISTCKLHPRLVAATRIGD